MITQGEIRVTSIGHIAHQNLHRSLSGMVSGTTSQGIFLQPSGNLTLYLTLEPFRGPLTINIRGKSGSLTSIQTGELMELTGNTITFSNSQLSIQFQRPLVWKPASPPRLKSQPKDTSARIMHQMSTYNPNNPYLPLLEVVTGGEPLSIKDLPGFEDHILQLQKYLQSGNPSDIISEMELILGVGPGLTPLGDDVLLGILLALTRARIQNNWSGDMIHFFHTVISKAREKTTGISWSLLSCAVQGTADERIIRVLDGLIAAREIPDHNLQSLLNWGSSSGIAVLAGMLMALT